MFAFFRVSKALLPPVSTKDMFALYNRHNKKELFLCEKFNGYIKNGEKYVIKINDEDYYIGTVAKSRKKNCVPIKPEEDYLSFTGKTFMPFFLTYSDAKTMISGKVVRVFSFDYRYDN